MSRTPEQEQVAQLLRTARESLGLSAAFLSRLEGPTLHFDVVDAADGIPFVEGRSADRDTTLCQAILDDKLPPVIPRVQETPSARELPLPSKVSSLKSFASAPVKFSDGSVYGTFCAAGFTGDEELRPRDEALIQVLAQAAAAIIEPGILQDSQRKEIERRLLPLMEAGGPTIVLQPIIDLATGERIGAEALSRFPSEWKKAPDICFAEAHIVGVGDELETIALQRAAELLKSVPGYISMNASPGTFLSQLGQQVMHDMPLSRVVFELSEHNAVSDYDSLTAAVTSLRERGMRLAIDDVGAGFSSMRHILLTSPDIIKLDRSIVDGLANDKTLHTLVRSLVDFGHSFGAEVVVEGVETQQDAEAVTTLKADLGQGYFWGKPGPPDLLAGVPRQSSRRKKVASIP